jgi:uncharacterized protein YbbK (DUF523 family)
LFAAHALRTVRISIFEFRILFGSPRKALKEPFMMVAASACLLGYCCRYDGRTSPSEILVNRAAEEAIFPICPEELGSLPTPRTPCELYGGDGFDVLEGRARVVDRKGNDVTQAFLKGAYAALKRIKENKIQLCFLKDRSPS